MKLRDSLLDALKTVPGTRQFHLHVLVSAPHKHAQLFPYASTRPRIYAQNILVLISEQVSVNRTSEYQPEPERKPESSAPGPDSAPGTQRVFVTAIEATLFHIPTTASAILYIAKVDSTGQGKRPAPTAAIVRALISFYASPESRPAKLRGTTLWVHLFARAERQYLFPNSAEHPVKKPLNDVKLCLWWKRLLGRVVQEMGNDGTDVKMYYVLPGMNELEALQTLGDVLRSNDEKGPRWIYGHPYSQSAVPLPYVPTGKATEPSNLGQLIPSFDDDPKSRFMDEIACTTQVGGLRSPSRKRRRTDSEKKDVNHENANDEKGKEKEKDKETRIHGELGVVSADEFWERMSFRQECVAGAITGFFVLIFPSHSTSNPKANSESLKEGLQTSTNPLAPQPGEVSHHLVQRVIHSLMTSHEFSTTERSLRATSILETSIRGLCSSGLSLREATAQRKPPQFLLEDGDESASVQNNHENGQEDNDSAFLEPPKTPPRRLRSLDDISPNPFPEPEPSSDTYSSFVYGEISVSNPDTVPIASVSDPAGGGSAAGGGTVTVLTVRKKKRK